MIQGEIRKNAPVCLKKQQLRISPNQYPQNFSGSLLRQRLATFFAGVSIRILISCMRHWHKSPGITGWTK